MCTCGCSRSQRLPKLTRSQESAVFVSQHGEKIRLSIQSWLISSILRWMLHAVLLMVVACMSRPPIPDCEVSRTICDMDRDIVRRREMYPGRSRPVGGERQKSMESNRFMSKTRNTAQRRRRLIFLVLYYSVVCLYTGHATAIGSENQSRIQRFVEEVDTSAQPMTVDDVAQQMNDPWARLVLRQRQFPQSVELALRVSLLRRGRWGCQGRTVCLSAKPGRFLSVPQRPC